MREEGTRNIELTVSFQINGDTISSVIGIIMTGIIFTMTTVISV